MARAIIRRKGREDVDLTPAFEPDIDMVETDEYLRIIADIPGVHYEDLDVLIADDGVIIRGERNSKMIYNNEESFRMMERKMGKIFRQIPVTTGIRHDDTELFYDNGVLVIHIPKLITTH